MSQTAPKPVAIIPARYGSSRFPGKPLAVLAGKPMIQHVWDRCTESHAFSKILVATDDRRIASAVKGFGGAAVLTSASCRSGTERVAEVARGLEGADVFVNVQGDEPAIHPRALAELSRIFSDHSVEMATLMRALEAHERDDPNVVKVVCAQNGDALYFSRAEIPFQRRGVGTPPRYAHVGLYGYRRETLMRLAALSPSSLETTEELEQLRALEHGIRARCVLVPYRSVGVDTPKDVARAEELLRDLATPS